MLALHIFLYPGGGEKEKKKEMNCWKKNGKEMCEEDLQSEDGHKSKCD